MAVTFQTETLDNLSPALLANIGVLVMNKEDVGWRMQLAMWVDRRGDGDRALMRRLTEVHHGFESCLVCVSLEIVPKNEPSLKCCFRSS